MDGEFCSARSVKEACDLLAKYGAQARVLAGGTDLMVRINRRQVVPQVLVSIGKCGLGTIREEGDNLVIGAAVTFAQIISSDLVQKHAPLLARALVMAGSPAIRNMATLGGNLANASPAADGAVAVLALGGLLKCNSATGERIINSADFWLGPGQTLLRPDELLTEIILPAHPGAKMAYRKLGQRRAEICAVASVGIVMEPQNGSYGNVRMAMGSVAPKPMLMKTAGMLAGKKRGDPELIRSVAEAVAGEISPIDDIRATGWYRRKASSAIVKQTLERLG
jgi:CO/xanthine dehydrogenase FAD-binding subunit